MQDIFGSTYLVTGAAGFIGSNVAIALHALGAKIVVADRFRNGDKWRNLSGIALHEIVMPEKLSSWLDQNGATLSGIVHMGAISATTERDVDKIVENNFTLSLNLWAAAAKYSLPFIYASSAATYGDGTQGFVDSENDSDLAALSPLNPYGWSKLIVDRRLLSDARADRVTPPQWAGLKFFNVYGPNEHHKGDMRSVINKIYPLVEQNKKISLFKSHSPKYEHGGQLRDFIYVKDCVKIILWLLDHPKVSGIFNVGTGTPRSFKDLAIGLGDVLGKSPEIEYIDMPLEIRDRYQYYTCADMRKLRQAGYEEDFYSLEAGIEDYVNCDLRRLVS